MEADLLGRVASVDYKNKGYFTVHTTKLNKTFKVFCPRNIFCPVSEDDVIYASVRMEPNGELTVLTPPFVQLPAHRDAIVKCFIRVLRGYGVGDTKANILYTCFLHEAQGKEEAVSSILSEVAQQWVKNKDEAILEKYRAILSLEAIKKLLMWWHKQRSLRRLYLFGLTNQEIEACKMPHEEIYQACLTNPYKLPPIALPKCDEIIKRQRKEIDPIDRRCGEIVRRIYHLMTNNGWTGVPSRILLASFPDYPTYKERLESEFGVRAEMHTVYLKYPFEAEKFISTYLDALVRSTYDGEELYGDPHYTREDLSPDQKVAVAGALKHPLTVITGGAGTGKCLHPYTKIFLKDGSIKYAKDLVIDDILLGEHSESTTILSTCTGEEEMFELTTPVGDSIICNRSHVLTLCSVPYTDDEGYIHFTQKGVSRWYQPRVGTPNPDYIKSETFDMDVTTFLGQSEAFRSHCYLYRVPCHFEKKRKGEEDEKELYNWALNCSGPNIPDRYKCDSIECRKQIIAGLLDRPDHDIFLEDLDDLLHSIGCHFQSRNVIEGVNASKIPIRTSNYTLVDSGPNRVLLPFTLKSLGPGIYCGFTLTGTGRFILANGLVTHNTTIIKEIIHNLELRTIPYAVVSFTGKAVSRIREVIHRDTPATMHRSISRAHGLSKFQHLIIDEGSMVSLGLLYEFLIAFPGAYSITLVGDCNQLQPIEWGSLFHQVIASGRIPVYKLEVVHRLQGGESDGIGINAKRIIEFSSVQQQDDYDYYDYYGKDYESESTSISLNPTGNGFEFTNTTNFTVMPGSRETVYDVVRALHSANIPADKLTIVSPYNKDVDELNKGYQQIYRDNEPYAVDAKGKLWKLGDRVMMTENNYDINIMNGEEGMVTEVIDGEKIIVTFRDNAVHSFNLFWSPDMEAGDTESRPDKILHVGMLCHSYAVTIHRSQGSEWDYVIVYVPESNTESSFLSKNMIYTAITRGRIAVWCIGDMTALHTSAQRSPSYRCDNLAQRLKEMETTKNI